MIDRTAKENEGVDPRHQHNVSVPRFLQQQPQADRDILISAQLIMSGINTLASVPEKFLRDYFAGQAMIQFMDVFDPDTGAAYFDDVSDAAYVMADAMLAAREKK